MNTKFAAALSEQSRFVNTKIGDFYFVPDIGAHIWQSKTAETMEELADQVNGAVASLAVLGDPFATLRVVQIGSSVIEVEAEVDPDAVTEESVKTSLIQANQELNQVIQQVAPPRPTLKLIEEAHV